MVRWSAGAAGVLLLAVCLPPRAEPRSGELPRAEGEAAREYRLSGLRDENGRIDVLTGVRERRAARRGLALRADLLPPRAAWLPRRLEGHAGRARSLVIDPAHPDVMWLAAGSGGVWKTEDGGASWRPLTDEIGLPSGCLVADPQDVRHLYWGTGERYHAGGPGAGIWETRNGGESWTPLPSTLAWPYVHALVVSTSDPRTLVVSAPGESSADSAVYRSTDSGATWAPTLQTGNLTFDLVADPSDPSRLLVAARARRTSVTPTTCLFRSTDSGATWTFSNGSCAPDDGQGTNSMAIGWAPSDPRVVYAVSRGGLLRSDDGGTSFALKAKTLPTFLAKWTTTIWVSPTDAAFVIVGGGALARSTDGGATFAQVDPKQHFDAAGHADTQRIVAPPLYDGVSSRSLYVLNDGGIDLLDDALAGSPRERSLDANLATTEVWAAGGSAAVGLVVGALQDTGYQGVPFASVRNPYVPGEGDGVCALFDPQDARYAYGCTPALGIFRFNFDGLGPYLSQNLHDEKPTDNVPANFLAPILLDPSAPWRMLAGGHSLWRSENVRDSSSPAWTEIKPRLTTPSDFDENVLSAVAVAPKDSNVIWTAYNGGRVFRTENGTAAVPAWIAVDDDGALDPLPNRRPLRLLIDRADSRRVLVSFGGFAPDNLWLTTDAGATWTARAGGAGAALPAAPVWALAQHPSRGETLYAGTEVGVFQSDDFGASWRLISAGAFTVAAQDLVFVQGTTTLLVGTFGRGLFTLETSRVPCLCRPRVPSGGA
jgi:photosystem II stability/assembly factor-like uncharacterized protein